MTSKTTRPMKIKRSSLYAASVGRMQEPMIIGSKLDGSKVCLTASLEGIAHAKELIANIEQLKSFLAKQHADALKRGWEDLEPFEIVD